MFIKKNNYDNSLRRVKIEFGKIIGLEEDKEAYVTLKELDTMTTLRLKDVTQSGNQNDLMMFFKDILPHIIVTHNLYETENKMMSNEEVTNFIYEKLELTSKIMGDYTKAMFQPNKGRADTDKVNKQDVVPETV